MTQSSVELLAADWQLTADKPVQQKTDKKRFWHRMKSLKKEKEADAKQSLITERRCFGQFGEYEECHPGECKDYEICKREHIDCYKGTGA